MPHQSKWAPGIILGYDASKNIGEKNMDKILLHSTPNNSALKNYIQGIGFETDT